LFQADGAGTSALRVHFGSELSNLLPLPVSRSLRPCSATPELCCHLADALEQIAAQEA
jgi:hypothetical protein